MIDLFQHQKDGIEFIINRGGSGALFWEMGCGKTRAALEIFSRLKTMHYNMKLFVVCPISLIESAWGEDIRKFTELTYQNLRKTKELDPKVDIYLINFEAMISRSKMPLILQVLQLKPMCVIDESSKIKSHTAKITKTMLAMRRYFQHRIVMSGTPAPNDETEYWSQISFANPSIFPDNFYKFRNIFFCLSRGAQFMQGAILNRATARDLFSKGWKYEIAPQMKDKLFGNISRIAHFAKKKECLDLPDQVDEIRKVEMTEPQRKAYRQMHNDCITYIQDKAVVAQVALTKVMKLRQITSSFALAQEGYAEIPGCPKTKELLAVLEEAGNQQAIIWVNFHAEVNKLVTLLGDKAVTLYGETKDKEASINDFKSGKVQYLIAHPRSAAYGLTFVQCSLQIFFSLDYSLETYLQSKSRTHRAGQVNKCTYIHLLCENSIDEVILKVLMRKGKEEEILYEFIKGGK